MKIYRREAFGITQNKMVQQGTGKYEDHGKELARNRKGNTVERQKRLETFRSSTRVKRKPCKKKDFVADVRRLIKCRLHMLRLA
jgi:hypothetical protein